MGDYLLVSRDAQNESARALAAELAFQAVEQGFSVTDLNPQVWLATRGPHPPGVLHVGGWALIGDVFDRRRPELPVIQRDDPWSYERKMVARLWGRYVGVQIGPDRQVCALLRDPSGALECVSWSQRGLTFACSSAQDWLLTSLRPDWRINVHRLAQAFHGALAGTGCLILDGPVALEPGTIQPLPSITAAHSIWRPADIATRSLGEVPSPEEAAGRLRDAVDEAVAGLAGLPGDLAAEVSGGLDSSIVAASLVRNRGDTVRLWLNTHGSTPESDERSFVVALAERLGFDPTCAPHATEPMTTAWLAVASTGFRPGLNALDRPHELDSARRVVAAGATAVITGRGGDSILFQNASPDIFTDLWRVRGWRAIRSPDMVELAAANEVSIWSLLRQARLATRAGHSAPARDHPLLAPLAERPAPHPWLSDLQSFGPGKVFHIAGVIDSVSLHSPTARSASVDVRNPLCAQPVVETCLALPTWLLALGGRERGLARYAFRSRLPSQIVDRRSKGDMTRLYGQMILNNLDVLREWLIGGRLADLGIIDRAAAERELIPEALIWRGRYGTIMAAAALEGWVRNWERRLGSAG